MKRNKKYRINEIFYSVQGEGRNTGRPFIFVRFSGCNRKCRWCDTEHGRFSEMTLDEIEKEVARYKCRSLLFTGGEPALQLDEEILNRFRRYYVAVETNGTKSLAPLEDLINWITVSPKSASFRQKKGSEIKIVYEGQDLTKYDTAGFRHKMLQPVFGETEKQTIDYVMEHTTWRLSVQTHKYLKIS
ncbi:MAG: radical SAM protein [Elusimicrobiaceae bacterium]|jgi:organic radical activating enzyme